VQQLLNCREPIQSPIRREDVLASGAEFRIPAGLLGVECEFGFVMQRDFPRSDEALDIAGLRSAIAECFAGLELVGRRVSDDVPLNEATAIAGFSLDAAVVAAHRFPTGNAASSRGCLFRPCSTASRRRAERGQWFSAIL
jgi:2-keto-4-pentenoate hydratase